MREVCLRELAYLLQVFRLLEDRVPPPQLLSRFDDIALRYKEQTPHQAILLKFARYISGLHAIDVLLLNGFVQEQGVIQRTLDEISEDILFISTGAINEEWTKLHLQFLAYFWEEEFDHQEAIKSTQKRGMVSRDKIRAHNHRAFGVIDTSTADRAGRSLHKAYSGYVHAAAPQIMDMCGGDPPRFFLSGMRGTTRLRDHADDAVNYFYRGLISANFAAKAFGVEAIASATYSRVRDFERDYGNQVLPAWANSKGAK